MDSRTDQQLLRDYAESRSEAAFAELVRRHLDFVYSAALRMVRDRHLAEDVTQSAFVALAQNARRLADRSVLSGWLHRTARNLAANVIRSDVRRRAREQEAAAMKEMLSVEPDAVWERMAPHLDAALGELSDPDRDALLLRYFEHKSARDMGQILGTSEEAAQRRVSRAAERLREVFAKRGITVGASGLAAVLVSHAVQAAPAGLAVAISTVVFAHAGIATTTAATHAIAMTTLQKTLATAVVVAGVATTLVFQTRSRASLRDANQSLRQRVAQLQSDNESLSARLARARTATVLKRPAPPVPSMLPRIESSAPDPGVTNLFARLENSTTKLTSRQIEPYLRANRRSASSLLAAYRTTGATALLEEAMQRYPGDPQVAFEAAFKKDASPEDRRHWIDAFKKSAPDNALPDYLSALEYFEAGQADRAVEDLIAASGKSQFRDYTLDRMQDDEEAYLTAGYSMAEAKTIPARQLLLPQLAQIKDLSQHIINLANSYRDAGDTVSAQAALQLAANLGQRYGNTVTGETEISRLVGLAVESIALKAMDPNSPYGSGSETVKDRLDYLAQQSAAIRTLAQQTEALEPKMSDQDWISYKDRWRVFGEEAAGRWLVNKYRQQ